MEKLEKIIKILRSHKIRITQSRIAVAEVLIKNNYSPLSADEIFNKIQNSTKLKCDQVSVYRSLATFERLYLVKKASFQGDAARYMLNHFEKKNADHHEHYFKCVDCNIIETFEDCLLSEKEKELRKNGYRKLNHHIEITGLCPACA